MGEKDVSTLTQIKWMIAIAGFSSLVAYGIHEFYHSETAQQIKEEVNRHWNPANYYIK
jgi:hypothetical protein